MSTEETAPGPDEAATAPKKRNRRPCEGYFVFAQAEGEVAISRISQDCGNTAACEKWLREYVTANMTADPRALEGKSFTIARVERSGIKPAVKTKVEVDL